MRKVKIWAIWTRQNCKIFLKFIWMKSGQHPKPKFLSGLCIRPPNFKKSSRCLDDTLKAVIFVLRVFGLYHTKEPDHCVIVLCMCAYVNKLWETNKHKHASWDTATTNIHKYIIQPQSLQKLTRLKDSTIEWWASLWSAPNGQIMNI